jgi:P22 tail accessory factor
MGFLPVSTATKRTIVEMAYEENSLAGYEFNYTPEELFTGLRRLDALMREWQPTLPLAYNFSDTFGGGDLDEPAGIPDQAIDVAAKYLALRINPVMGKDMNNASVYALAAGLSALRAQALFVPTVKLPDRTPRGIGNRPWSIWSPFVRNNGAPANLTAQTLALTASAATAGVTFSTVILNTTDGSLLTMCNSIGGRYSLSVSTATGVNVWTLTRVSPDGVGTTERPVVTEWADDVYGLPKSTPFSVTVA